MSTTLTGYTAGASGANWFLSADMLNKFNEMAKAAAADTKQPVTITIVDGYISKYELIRQLTTKHGYADQTIKDNVTAITKNASVTPEQWTTLETYFKDKQNFTSGKPARYKYTSHPYLKYESWVGELPGATNEDVRRTGNYVRISPGLDPGKWNEAQWLLHNSYKYGFIHVGPEPDVFLFDPNWKFGEDFIKRLDSLDVVRLWLYYAATNSNNAVISDNDRSKILQELPTDSLANWDRVKGDIQKKGDNTGPQGGAFDAVTKNRPWLLLADKW